MAKPKKAETPAEKTPAEKTPAKKAGAAPAPKTKGAAPAPAATKAAEKGKNGSGAAPAKNEGGAMRAGRKSAYPADVKIIVVAKENPRRPGTNAARRYDIYKTGVTVAAALAKGFSFADLADDVAKGVVRIG